MSQRSRKPWALMLAALMLFAGLTIARWYATRPEAPISLASCDTAEAVTVLVDESSSVADIDRSDQRGAAVRQIVQLLASEPCTPSDVVTVISFTEIQAITGPATASSLPRIERTGVAGTDIAAAVEAGIDIADERPGFRHIFVLISDLQEGSSVPVNATLDRLAGTEVVVVSVGDAVPTNGVTEIDLRGSQDIARSIADQINQSRRNT